MICQGLSNFKDEIVHLRRDFHMHPELGFEVHRSAGIVSSYLAELGLKVQTGIGKTGVIGLLSGKSPGKTLLLRADMDALPIQEKSDVEYKSLNEGIMHACGHDGHMAILLITAKILTAHREDFTGQIKFVFQPAEEGLAGARLMIEEGVLDNPKVDAALGLHLINQLPLGIIGVRSGPLLASMDSFSIRIKGKGGHAGMPEDGVDAILISAYIISALQSLISKEISPLFPLVVHVGTIHGGSAFNIIADNVEMEGTARTIDETIRKTIPERMERIIKGITAAFRGDCELDYRFGYPPVINNEVITELVKSSASRVNNVKKIIESGMSMGSDDFAFYLQNVPGCYFLVGAGNSQKGFNQPLHSSRFDFDEDALTIAAATMVEASLSYFNK